MTSHPTRYPPDPQAVSWRAMFVLGGLVLTVLLIPVGTIVLAAEELVSPEFAANQWVLYEPDARVQEDIGNRILAVERYHSERLSQLARRWSHVSDDARSFAEGRNARLQEALGLSIATTAQRVYIERSSLEPALARGLA